LTRPVPPDLPALAKIFAEWIQPVPDIPAVYLFGSRVRGDHRRDSDVDVRLYVHEWDVCQKTLCWWQTQNETDFAELKARLPGPLALHRENQDDADAHIRAGRENPVLKVGRVVCVWTPPKPNPDRGQARCSTAE
jgi:predicted nucleotidyltransferase